MKLTKSYSYTNDRETRTFTVRVGVSVDFKFYFARDQIPTEILERTEATLAKRTYGDSWYELDGMITDMIENYEAAFVEELREKVILYKYDRDEVHGVDGGTSMAIGYRVVWKYTAGDEVRYLEERRRGTSMGLDSIHDPLRNLDGKLQEMPWTAEREAWFRGITARVEELARQIRSGIGSTPTVLARKIDQNGALMLPGRGDDDGQD